MSQQATIKRYALILKKVQEDTFPNLESIRAYLEQKSLGVSSRTVQRDLEQLAIDFGVTISYNRQKRGYYISETDKIQLEPFMRLLERFDTAEMILSSIADSKETLNCISFDVPEKFSGSEFLKPLLQALREKRKVTFLYQTFFEGPTKPCELFPYLLKEYQGRWYLVGCFYNGQKLYFFGLDRISDLRVEKACFTPVPSVDARQRFHDIIGVSDLPGEKQRVVLSFSPQQGKYVKSLPLHPSQKILSDTKRECKVELNVVLNFELNQKILMHGSSVKVIEPKELADEIRQELQDAFSQY